MQSEQFNEENAFLQQATFFLKEIPFSIEEAADFTGLTKETEIDQQTKSKEEDFAKSLKNTRTFQRSVSAYVGSSKRNILQKHSSLFSQESTLGSPPLQAAQSNILRKNKSTLKNIMKMKYMSNSMLINSRLLYLESYYSTPVVMTSIIPYIKESSTIKGFPDQQDFSYNPKMPELAMQMVVKEAITKANKDVVSYKSLLDPSNRTAIAVPTDLSSAEWMTGKHRTVLALNGYMVSVIEYTKPSELRFNLNLKFSQSFPSVGITLSKVRSLQQRMQRVARSFDFHTGVLDMAVAFFYRLVFACKIAKTNRHMVTAACLLLSAKLHGDLRSGEAGQVLSALEHSFKAGKDEILAVEFSVFAALDFSLIK